MKKILILLTLLMSINGYAQRKELIGSWLLKKGITNETYQIETFLPNGVFRFDVFTLSNETILHASCRIMSKWSLDQDGVLTLQGVPNLESASMKIYIREDADYTPAERKRMKEYYASQEKELLQGLKVQLKTNRKLKEYFDIRFTSEGHLEKQSAQAEGWDDYIKIDKIWNPSSNKGLPNFEAIKRINN